MKLPTYLDNPCTICIKTEGNSLILSIQEADFFDLAVKMPVCIPAHHNGMPEFKP